MAAAAAARTWKPLLKERVETNPVTLKELARLYLKTNIRPVYQREIKWSQENMSAFVVHILSNGILNGSVMLYGLTSEERGASPLLWECVDGQHRIFTAYHYINALPVELPGKKPFLISAPYKDAATGATTHIFFKETADTHAFAAGGASVAYMTDEEQEEFCDYLVDVKKIREPLTLDARRKLFLAAQRGVPVRGSDLLKNVTDLSLIRYIVEERAWEGAFKAVLTDRCHVKPKNYWLHWIVRMYLLTTTDDHLKERHPEVVDRFVITDSEIGKMIKGEHSALDVSEAELTAFGTSMDRFLSYLDTLPSKVVFSPFHFYALYAHVAVATDDRLVELRPLLNVWAEDEATKHQKKAWESRALGSEAEDRAEYFTADLAALTALSSASAPLPPAPRKKFGKKDRAELWAHSFGTAESTGACYVCNCDLCFADKWEVSHVVAHALGGSDELTNLRVNCRTCNRKSGTTHMETVKKRTVPVRKPPAGAGAGVGATA